jgi:hypothetical protein
MKVLCPLCGKTINLGYLEKKGDQTAYCSKCNITIYAAFKKDKIRLYWEVYFEKPVSKEEKESPPVGCGMTIWIAIALLLVVITVARCDQPIADRPSAGASEQQFQN